MPKTHSTVKHFDDIGKLYSEGVAPKTQGELLTEGDVDTFPKAGEEGPVSNDFNKTGPGAADGVVPVENDPKKKSEKELAQSANSEDKLSQPIVAEGKKKKKGKGKPPWIKDGDDDNGDDDGDDDGDSGDDKEKGEKSVKKESNKINNSTMRQNNNKSTFDRLFETVMGEDLDDLDMAMGDEEGGGFGDDEGLGDEEGLNGDMITLELPRDVAETLHGALGDLLNGGGEEEGGIEDLEDAEGLDGEGMGEEGLAYRESHVELQAAPDSVTALAGMNNKVGGKISPTGGSADSGSSGQEDGGKPKAQSDAVASLTGKSNKVGGKVTGGNKDLFKA